MRSKSLAILIAVLSTSMHAQGVLSPGDIAFTPFSTNTFHLFTPGSGVLRSINVGSFQGSGTSQSIAWDPSTPDSFYVGGFGFVGRATMTGPNTATYTLLNSNIGTAAQLSVAPNGQIVVAGASSNNAFLVDPVTGAETPVTQGPQPWGTTVNAGAIDPLTGDIYVGNNGSIYRIPAGTATPVLFATGWTTGTSYVSGIAFDLFTGEVLATLLSVNRVVRISPAGAISDIVPAGSLSSPNSIAVDPANGDIIVASNLFTITRIPFGGGPVVTENAGGGTSSPSGVTVVGSLASTTPDLTAFGTGGTGSGGTTTISSASLPFLGNPFFPVDLAGGAPNSAAYLYLALAGVDPGLPIGGGSFLYLEPTAMLQAIAAGISPIGPLPTSAAGATTFILGIPNDPAAAGLHVFLQAAGRRPFSASAQYHYQQRPGRPPQPLAVIHEPAGLASQGPC